MMVLPDYPDRINALVVAIAAQAWDEGSKGKRGALLWLATDGAFMLEAAGAKYYVDGFPIGDSGTYTPNIDASTNVAASIPGAFGNFASTVTAVDTASRVWRIAGMYHIV